MNDDDIKKFLKENEDLFESLASGLMCPGCNKVVHPPFRNLGVKFHQAEGCEDCYEKEKALE